MTNMKGDKFTNFSLKPLKGKNHLEDLDDDGRATLKRFKKQTMNFLLDSGQGPTSGSCRHCKRH